MYVGTDKAMARAAGGRSAAPRHLSGLWLRTNSTNSNSLVVS